LDANHFFIVYKRGMGEALKATIMVKPGRRDSSPFFLLSDRICGEFNQCASEASIPLNWNKAPWPTPRSQKSQRLIQRDQNHPEFSGTSFEYLKEHQNDIAICVVADINQIDPALAYMLYIQRGCLQHIFVVVTDGSSDYLNHLHTIDLPLFAKRNGTLYIPKQHSSALSITQSSAMGAGYLSVHHAKCVNKNRVCGLLELANLRKSGDL
jgi:hypothetical protein